MYSDGWCPEHRKLVYFTRKKAREAAKKLHPNEHKMAYRCQEDNSGRWHYGTCPPAMFQGKKTRSELYTDVAS